MSWRYVSCSALLILCCLIGLASYSFLLDRTAPLEKLHNYYYRTVGMTGIFMENESSIILHTTQDQTSAMPSADSTVSRCSDSKKKHIAYFKNPKAASSTIQNILYRLADDCNLTIAVGKGDERKGDIHLGWPDYRFSPSLLATPGMKPDILANHMLFDEEGVRAAMAEDTVLIGIVRDPATHFISKYHYDHGFEIFGPIEKFLTNKTDHQGIFSIKSPQMHAIGASADLYQASSPNKDLTKFFDYLNRAFDLMIIAEKMDESLTLMSHLLNWEISDVVHFRSNVLAREGREKSTDNYETVKDLIYKRAVADVELYKYFVEVFEERTNQFGSEKIEQNARQLSEASRHWWEMCLKGWNPSYGKNGYMLRITTEAQDLKKCRQLTYSEQQYYSILKKRTMNAYRQRGN